MLTLGIKTDGDQAELYVLQGNEELGKIIWESRRQLADTIHTKIDKLLEEAGKELSDVDRVAVFQGPGSFTGLRIGISVANTLAYGLNVPVVGDMGDDWLNKCVDRKIEKFTPVSPVYGKEPNITKPRK